MAASNAFLRTLVQVALIWTALAMLAAVLRAVGRVVTGRPLWSGPTAEVRPAPWDWRAVVLVLLTFLLCSVVTSEVYSLTRKHTGWRVGPPAPAAPRAPVAPKPVPAPLPAPAPPASSLTFIEQMFLVSVVNALLLAAVPLLLRRFARVDPRAALGLVTGRVGPALAAGAAAFLFVTPAVYAVNGLALLVFRRNGHPVELMLQDDMSPSVVVLALLSAVVLAPAAEELVFRGILQGWLTRVFLGPSEESFAVTESVEGETRDSFSPAADLENNPYLPPPPTQAAPTADPRMRRASRMAVVTTSLLFAVVHAPQMPAPFAIFVLSLALGSLYVRTGSLAAPFALHALFNGLSTVVMLVNGAR